MAIEVDPHYSTAVATKAAFFDDALSVMDAKLEIIRRDDIKDVARKVKVEQLKEIEIEMEKERAVVKRAEQFKFTDVILQSFAADIKK
jgi:hypothetical protein